jgi:hypothetical protein
MGSALYKYVVNYKADINEALQELREREFRAGRYNPVIESPFDLFPIGPHSPAPALWPGLPTLPPGRPKSPSLTCGLTPSVR